MSTQVGSNDGSELALWGREGNQEKKKETPPDMEKKK